MNTLEQQHMKHSILYPATPFFLIHSFALKGLCHLRLCRHVCNHFNLILLQKRIWDQRNHRPITIPWILVINSQPYLQPLHPSCPPFTLPNHIQSLFQLLRILLRPIIKRILSLAVRPVHLHLHPVFIVWWAAVLTQLIRTRHAIPCMSETCHQKQANTNLRPSSRNVWVTGVSRSKLIQMAPCVLWSLII
jgi:hypothetical protein